MNFTNLKHVSNVFEKVLFRGIVFYNKAQSYQSIVISANGNI